MSDTIADFFDSVYILWILPQPAIEADPANTKHRSLESDGPRVLHELRRAVSEVVSSLPARATRATELADALRLDRSLGWKVWKVAFGTDALPAAKHIPGRVGAATFMSAAREAGASAASLESVAAAFQAFERLTRTHAGDRAHAEILLGGFTGEGRRRLELGLRRDAYRANSHFLGVAVRSTYQVNLIYPGDADEMNRVVLIRGHYGLRRTRAAVACVLGRSTLVQEGGEHSNYRRDPIDGGLGPGEAPLLREFCSSPTPPVARRVIHRHTFEDELAAGPMGEGGAVDIVTGERVWRIPRDPVIKDAVTMALHMPCERACFDIVLHKDLSRGQTPGFRLFSTVHTDKPFTAPDDRYIIPMPESPEFCGEGRSITAAAEAPDHAGLIRRAFEAAGVDPEGYRCFRLRLRMPPIPSRLAAWYTLPPLTP